MRHSRTAKNETRNKNNSTRTHANNKAWGAISQAGTPSTTSTHLYMLIDSFTHT